MGAYEHRVLCGGNHDYILEQLDEAQAGNAARLCESYNVKYLHTKDNPSELPLKCGQSIKIWGSGISAMKGLSAHQAIASGNNSFQQAPENENLYKAESAHLTPGCADVIVTHAPPAGILRGQDGKNTFAWINEQIKTVKPSLYICGHAHNASNPSKDCHADIEGVLGINACVVGVWNQFHGM